jgi:hypothetical protein
MLNIIYTIYGACKETVNEITQMFKKEPSLYGKVLQFEDGSFRYCKGYYDETSTPSYSDAYDCIEKAIAARDDYLEVRNAKRKEVTIRRVLDA